MNSLFLSFCMYFYKFEIVDIVKAKESWGRRKVEVEVFSAN